MAVKLLWGINSSYCDESQRRTQVLFDKRKLSDQQRAVNIAFEYKHNQEVYGSGTQMEWMNENWGTTWSENFSQRLLAEDEIEFATKNGSGKVIADKLSQQFPEIEFRLQYSNEQDYSGEYIFKDGLIKETEVWELHS